MLRTIYSLDVLWRREVAHILVCLADTIVARTGRILYVSNSPGAVAHELESRHAFAFLISFEIDEILSVRLMPRTSKRMACRGEESRLTAFFLYHHVVKSVGWHEIDVCINGGVAPIEEQTRLSQRGKGLVSV